MELKITFTGICAFVANTKASRCKAVVLLPDGDSGEVKAGKAVDGKPLFRHRAYVKFKANHLSESERLKISDRLEVIRYLKAERVTIRPVGSLVDLTSNLSTIANLDKVVPGFGEVDRQFLGEKPLRLAAQVLLEHGYLVASPPAFQWAFPNNVSRSDIITGPLSHEVTLTIAGLTSVDLIVTPFDGAPETLSLVRRDGGTVEVCIANLCDENPLRWPTVREPLIDNDFRWYYELVARRDDLGRRLSSLGLPVPHPIDAKPNGQGMNCLGATLKATDFYLDNFLPPMEAMD